MRVSGALFLHSNLCSGSLPHKFQLPQTFWIWSLSPLLRGTTMLFGTPPSLYLFQKIPPGRKMELSSKIHITCCPYLGDPSPVLLVVWCLKAQISCILSNFLVAYNCQAIISQQLQSILLWGHVCFQLLKHTCFLTVFLHISLLFYGYINILGMLIRMLFMSFSFLELVVFHWGKFPLLSQFGHYFCPNSQWVLIDW